MAIQVWLRPLPQKTAFVNTMRWFKIVWVVHTYENVSSNISYCKKNIFEKISGRYHITVYVFDKFSVCYIKYKQWYTNMYNEIVKVNIGIWGQNWSCKTDTILTFMYYHYSYVCYYSLNQILKNIYKSINCLQSYIRIVIISY